MTTSLKKSVAVAVIHGAVVLSVWANYAWQQRSLPRAWARAAPYDPYDVLRGRYVQLRVTAAVEPGTPLGGLSGQGRLFVQGGRLHLAPAECCVGFSAGSASRNEITISQPVRFYIPENIPDPSRLEPGDELWVEVTVPPDAAPRPLQMARKKKDGSWIPLRLDPGETTGATSGAGTK